MKKGRKYTYSFEVTYEIYKGFIGIFKDNNPLHTDIAFAKARGFKDLVMHGNILGGFISYFVGECLPEKKVIIYTQSIKYLHPVFLGDRLELNTEIIDIFESVNTFEFKFYFKNQEDKKVARGDFKIGLLL